MEEEGYVGQREGNLEAIPRQRGEHGQVRSDTSRATGEAKSSE